MGALQQQLHTEHKARMRRLWDTPPRRVIVPTPPPQPVSVTVAPPVAVAEPIVVPPIPTPEESRAARLRRLEGELRDLALRVRAELKECDEPAGAKIIEPPIRLIIRTVAAYYNISMTDFLSPRRTANIAHPRQIAMYVTKEMTRHGFPTIGRHFGGRDHTTILHAVRKVEALRAADPKLNREINELTAMLTPKPEGKP